MVDQAPRPANYAQRLQEALMHAGLDAKALARHIGITYVAVWKVLRGDSAFLKTPQHFAAAERLGVRPEWLATGAGPMREGSDSTVDWRTIAFSVAAAHPHEAVRAQLLDFCDRVDTQAASLSGHADRHLRLLGAAARLVPTK